MSSSANFDSSLSVNSLCYGPAKLHNIQLNVARADRVALMGPNGSGKSTLLKIIHGLIPPDSGSVIKDHSPHQVTSLNSLGHWRKKRFARSLEMNGLPLAP